MVRRVPVDTLPRIAALAGVALVAGCSRHSPPPPRVDAPVELPQTASTIVVPISAKLADLQAGLNKQVPHVLWTIDRVEPKCVPGQHVKVFGKSLKVTPTLSCRITGQVTRGAMNVTGHGQTLHVTMPISAAISARNIGGIVKKETATGAAAVSADVRLSVSRDWTPNGKVSIDYDWTEAPGVTLLGKRITFTDKADAKLQGVIAKLQRQLPQELAKLDARAKVADAWRQGFTSIMLNRDHPPVWLRIAPRRVSFGGYRVVGDRLELTAAAQALTQTFVGNRPPDPTPVPLPDLSHDVGAPHLRFAIPVLADYDELEPVLGRALVKLNAKGISLPHVGRVDVRFGKIDIYATENHRLAVGVDAVATPANKLIGQTKGRVYLTATPYNAPDSEVVQFQDLKVSGDTDSRTLNTLLMVFKSTDVLDTVRSALTQNFAKDYAKILRTAADAIAEKRQGDFVLSARIARVSHGRIVPTGQGLFMPVVADGQASITYRPQR